MPTIIGNLLGPEPTILGNLFGPGELVEPPPPVPPSGIIEATGTLVFSRQRSAINDPLYRGEVRLATITVMYNGVPVDIAAGAYQLSSLEYVLANDLEDGTPVALTKSLTTGIELSAQTGATLGQAAFALATADTKNLAPGDYWEMVSGVFVSAPGQHVYLVPPRRRILRSVPKVPA